MGFVTQWRGRHGTDRRRLLGPLLLSLLLHVPFTPLAVLFGLLGLLQPPAETALPELESLDAIVVDLVDEGAGAPAPAPSEPAPAPEAEGVALLPEPVEKTEPKLEPVDAGIPEPPDEGPSDAALEAPDAGADDAKAPPSDAEAASDAGADAGELDADPGIDDPVAQSGAAARIVESNANVRLFIYTEELRKHRLGPRIGELLRSVYQWRDFFGPTAIDPVRDIDRILIVGPQLRDSSKVAAVLRYNVPEERVREAIETLVARDPEGSFLDAGVKAARARADRAERVFVMPAPQIVVVTPPSALKSALRWPKGQTLPGAAAGEVATLHLATPWRAAIGLPFRVPKSIKWVRVKVTLRQDGGAVARIEALDEDAEHAAENAAYLDRTVRAMTSMRLGVLGALLGKSEHRFVENVSFEARGDRILGTVTATERQLASALELLSGYLVPRPPPAVRPSTDAGGPDPAAADAGARPAENGAAR